MRPHRSDASFPIVIAQKAAATGQGFHTIASIFGKRGAEKQRRQREASKTLQVMADARPVPPVPHQYTMFEMTRHY